jgi:predicted RNase H-like HicB family nuclease
MTDAMWTNERKVDALLRLPWRLRVTHGEENGHWVMRADEIPSALATGSTPEEVETAFWESLRESLLVYLECGDPIPLPAGVKCLPWQLTGQPVRVVSGQLQLTAALAFIASQQEANLVNA